MLDVFLDAIIDSLKLLPFLFITYLIMEYIEHKTKNKTKETIRKSGKFGPLIGSILGIIPQCGFSVSATNLYAARVITLGTLISVYLSTSDEMLPIFISEAVSIEIIVKILAIKLFVGMFAGFIIDFIFIKKHGSNDKEKIIDICEKDHCDCEHGIVKSSVKHTLNIFVFILIVTLLINLLIFFIGEENITSVFKNIPILGAFISGAIGLIPNCASSVIITKLYIENIIPTSTLIAGLLVNAGVGIAVLFKTNEGIKNNLKIVGLLYFIGVSVGIIFEILGIVF